MRGFLKFGLVVFATTLLAISCKSNEQKAEALIKDYMFKHLHDYNSYEIVETKVDSAYNRPFYDKAVMSAALSAVKANKETKEHYPKYNRAKSTMEIWEDSFSSAGRREYRNARKEYLTEFKKFTESFLEYNKSMFAIASTLDTLERQFIGWVVDHKYRCNNRDGNTVLGNDMFVMDRKFKVILFHFDNDDEEYSEAIDQIQLAQALGKMEFEESITSCKDNLVALNEYLNNLD
ncbi:MAG: hypothetical protein IJV27_11665 [Prevotella sp.]|nr:hypothetical protein [Prevotella sp.]